MNRHLHFDPLCEPSSEQILEEYIRLRREIETQVFLFPIERPDFGPKQIRSVEELTPGCTYRVCNSTGKGYSQLWIFHSVVENKFGRSLDMTSVEHGYRSHSHYLTDRGLAPYRYGNWNPSNWIERL